MPPFKSLGRRIVNAYLLFALGCCLFFAIIAAVVVEGIEIRMVDERLREVAAWASPRHAANLPVEMPTGLSFYHGESIPLSLRNVSEGVQEMQVDGIRLHVLAGQNATGPFVVVDHESDYHSVELAVYSLLGAGFLGFLAMSLVLGRFMARRVVTPIVSLSTAVAGRRSDLPLQDNHDELGILARAFAGHTNELQQFLDRERFFTGDVSHELRTPLTVISGAAEILMAETREMPALHAPVERIVRSSQNAAETVSILLLLARAPELIESDMLSMAQVVRDEVARHQPLVSNKDVRLVGVTATDFSVRAPGQLVSAAIGNLIRNACSYTDEGTVTVSLGDSAVVVHDTGRGLPPAVQAMLRGDLDGAALRGSEGTGLGLALVRRICQYLGATLNVASASGNGTVFTIVFKPA